MAWKLGVGGRWSTGTSGRVALLPVLAVSLAIGGGVAASCTKECTSQPDCGPPGVVVAFQQSERLDVASTTICVNGECETIDWRNGRVATFSFPAHEIDWRPGSIVEVSVSVVNESGQQLASTDEQRTMTTPPCGCAGFSYRLDDTDLARHDS